MSRVSGLQAWENFRRRVAEFGGEVLAPQWLGALKPHRCRCIQGHDCWPRPSSIQQGQGMCRICVNENNPANVRKTAAARDAFYKSIAELGGTVLEPAWLGNQTRHKIRCQAGHVRKVKPNNIQAGQGICQICGGKNNPLNVRKAATAEVNFRRRVAEQGGVILEPAYRGGDVPHHVLCARSHERMVRPSDLKSGRGLCRICSWWGQDVLYIVRNPATGWVKFGITSRDGRDRLDTHRASGYTEILRLETGLPEGVAVLTEQKIKTALEMVGAVPVQGREYFSGDYLALIENEVGNWLPTAAAA